MNGRIVETEEDLTMRLSGTVTEIFVDRVFVAECCAWVAAV